MPLIGRMDKIVLYDQPVIGEKTAAIIDMKANYNTWSQNHVDTHKSDFYSEEDEKKNLVPEYYDYFRRPPVNLEWRNISLKTPDGRKILDGLNGSANSGELTAIMGPSGAGKTSLLNVLTGYIQKRVSGQIYVNGVPRDMITYRKLTCYILQDNHILDCFTVKELVTIASRLKLPTTMSEKERQKIVEDCIYSFGLDGHQNQRASTLSGGQRKRVCIAQEIVNNPPLVFLDEPTSGLDSSSSLQCMQLLKSLATEGKNIVCTIHQPSSRIYEIFDNIYMISEGQCIFRGATKNLIPFLANQGLTCPKYHSPTDFIIDVAIGLYGDWNWKLRNAIDSEDDRKGRWFEIDSKKVEQPRYGCCQSMSTFSLFKNKIKNAATDNWLDESFSGYATSFSNQLQVLLKRSYYCIVRAPHVLFLKLAASVLTGLLFGSLYYNTGNDGSLIFNTSGFLFTLMVFLIVSAKIPTILTFPSERAVFEKEHMNGWYSTTAYYIARTTANFPFQITYPAVCSIIVYLLSGQPKEFSRLGFFVLSTVMLSLIAESIGFLLGAAFSVETGTVIGTTLLGPAILLGGCLLALRDTPAHLKWLCHLTYTRYGIQSIYLDLYSNNRSALECSQKMCFFTDPEKFLKFVDMEGDMFVDYMVLLGFILTIRISSFIVLFFRASRIR